MTSKRSIFIGFEPREAVAFFVAVAAMRRQMRSSSIPIQGLELAALRVQGLYTRPTYLNKLKDGTTQLFDKISSHPMSTEFAISRFLTPLLAGTGWTLFTDCDVLPRIDMNELFSLADPRYAVMVVKHEHIPTSNTKMCGQVQSYYPRKNWSSVCLFNCQHPANKLLDHYVVNNVTGRWLHGFSWLKDEEIGELPVDYNYLVGTSVCVDPKIIHFTEGGPWLTAYKNVEYAELWQEELRLAVASTSDNS